MWPGITWSRRFAVLLLPAHSNDSISTDQAVFYQFPYLQEVHDLTLKQSWAFHTASWNTLSHCSALVRLIDMDNAVFFIAIRRHNSAATAFFFFMFWSPMFISNIARYSVHHQLPVLYTSKRHLESVATLWFTATGKWSLGENTNAFPNGADWFLIQNNQFEGNPSLVHFYQRLPCCRWWWQINYRAGMFHHGIQSRFANNSNTLSNRFQGWPSSGIAWLLESSCQNNN